MYFEFDTRKSDSNKAKHGIDFVEAQALWKSKHVLLGAKDALEKRYMIIGRIGTQHWSAIITYRGGIIRIISVRKSTATEIETYEKIAR
ncbi:MAG: toxin [Verrucomicrobia bacterium]|nr:MAG: toxin [Verrucomicrobiota bacterium]